MRITAQIAVNRALIEYRPGRINEGDNLIASRGIVTSIGGFPGAGDDHRASPVSHIAEGDDWFRIASIRRRGSTRCSGIERSGTFDREIRRATDCRGSRILVPDVGDRATGEIATVVRSSEDEGLTPATVL